ncbi:MAG: LapA family protein [Pseudomonadota bacterium]
MRYLFWPFGIVLFLLALGFAVKNGEPVTLYYYLGYQWRAPLVLIILAFFCAGVVSGIVASLGLIFRQRRELLAVRRELRSKAQAAEKRRSAAEAAVSEQKT